MGVYPSRTKNKEMCVSLMNKKITSNVPIYLSSSEYLDEFASEYKKNMILMSINKPSVNSFIAKLKPGICFYVDDIIWYCFNEGCVYAYNLWISFVNQIDESYIDEINFDNSIVSEIYDSEYRAFNLKHINKYTYSSDCTFGTTPSKHSFNVSNIFSYASPYDEDMRTYVSCTTWPIKYNRVKMYKY
jgi:hypothetical protein